jgi:hypothetical protein
MFPLAEFLKNIQVEPGMSENMKNVRQIIFDAIVHYRKIKNRGIVAVFNATGSTCILILPALAKVHWEARGEGWLFWMP